MKYVERNFTSVAVFASGRSTPYRPTGCLRRDPSANGNRPTSEGRVRACSLPKAIQSSVDVRCRYKFGVACEDVLSPAHGFPPLRLKSILTAALTTPGTITTVARLLYRNDHLLTLTTRQRIHRDNGSYTRCGNSRRRPHRAFLVCPYLPSHAAL